MSRSQQLNIASGDDYFIVVITAGDVTRVIWKSCHGATLGDYASLDPLPIHVRESLRERVLERINETHPFDYEDY